jgi:hypothetical protein
MAFNKPLNEIVANFINDIFETTYSGDDIVSHTRDLKNIREKANNINVTFSTTNKSKDAEEKTVDSE